MEKYQELSKRHMDEFETLPIFWAYSNKQLEEGMSSFNLSMSDVKQIRCICQGQPPNPEYKPAGPLSKGRSIDQNFITLMDVIKKLPIIEGGHNKTAKND